MYREKIRSYIGVIEGNILATSISYPDDTCSPQLTHQWTGHQSMSARSMVSKEKTLYLAELIEPTYISRDAVANNPFNPRDAIP